MMINRRLKAFTITEMLVTMMISSMVLASGYWAYTNIIGEFSEGKGSISESKDLVLVYMTLKHDWEKAEIITGDDSSLELYSSYDTVRYGITPGYICRIKRQVQDTFPVGLSNCKILFEERIYLNIPKPIRSLSGLIVLSGDSMSLFLEKKVHVPDDHIISPVNPE